MVIKFIKLISLGIMSLLMLAVDFIIFAQAFVYANIFYVVLAIIGLVSWLIMLWSLHNLDDPDEMRAMSAERQANANRNRYADVSPADNAIRDPDDWHNMVG
jgi:hypothetical protein